MAPSTNTNALPLVYGQEVTYASIVGPFDFVCAYVDAQGGSNSNSEWRLFATVNGLRSQVGRAQYSGRTAQLLQWETDQGTVQTVKANGTLYELVGYSEQVGPPTVKASIVGYDQFDTVADDAGGSTVQIPANFAEITIATLAGGYHQFADIGVDQSAIVPCILSLYALAGVGGVEAVIKQIPLQADDHISDVLQNYILPGATQYRLTVKANGTTANVGPNITVSISVYSTEVQASAVVNLNGDVSGPSNGNTVDKINGTTIPAGGALTTGTVLRATGLATAGYGAVDLANANAVTGVLPTANQTAQAMGGDVSGTTAAATVAKVNGTTVPAGGALTTGTVLRATGPAAAGYGAVDLANASAVTGVLPTANQTAQAMGGDVSGTTAAATVAKINGTTVPAGGALTTGTVLRATGLAAAGYGAVDLANANAVTGVLPTANQTAQAMGGDISGTTAAATVAKINGTTVPAGGALTTGTVLRATGPAAAGYGAVDLANANAVTGVLPTANQASQAVAGDASGTTGALTVAKVNGTAIPAAPAATALLQATSPTAGTWVDPASGTPNLPFMNNQNHHTYYWAGLNSTSSGAVAWGFKTLTTGGTPAEATPSSGSKLNGTRRVKCTVVSATSQLGIWESANAAGSRYLWRGDAAGRGGFKCVFRWAVVSSGNNSTWLHHVGIDNSNTPASVDYLTNTSVPRVTLAQTYTATAGGAVPAATNWKMTECDGAAVHLTDTGIAVIHGNLLELIIYCTPNGTVQWTLNDLTAGTTASGSCTTNPPPTTTFMAPTMQASISPTAGTGTCEVDIALMAGEMFD